MRSAMRTAPGDFGLRTPDDILAFIADGGLEHPEHANTAPWENNPNPATEILVDSYNFYSGMLYGYLAFFYQPVSRRWFLKSLKKNNRPSPRAFLADKFKKAGYGPK